MSITPSFKDSNHTSHLSNLNSQPDWVFNRVDVEPQLHSNWATIAT